MRVVISVMALVGLVACAPPVPDSGAVVSGPAAGVGFNNYDNYLAERQAREAALRRQGSAPQPQTVRPPATTGNQAQTSAQQTAAQAVAAVRGTQPAAPAQTAPVQTASVTPQPATVAPPSSNPDISDEQDFGAVSARESIQSDAQRRQQQSAQYEVIAPTAVPQRPSNRAQTPIEFALTTSHPVGSKQYRRGLAINRNKAVELCRGYQSNEQAQDAFLKAGGPKRDKLGIDPDGDGYACGWNPGQYRNIRNG